MDAAIRATNLEKSFGEVHAVDGVDLEIGAGEIYGFLGPNGAGKTTTVRMLCTLLVPTAGQATVAGFNVASHPQDVRLNIGVAMQEAALDQKLTGVELLKMQGMLYGLSKSEINERISELTSLIDIGDALGRRIATYSGGMKRRLDLAAALVHNPKVLFLDEPTTGLDPTSRRRVWEEINLLNRNLHMTIFLTTQYLEEADELAHRVGIIDEGKLVAEGTPTELKRHIGVDVIVGELDERADPSLAVKVTEAIPGVERVEHVDQELRVHTSSGSATLSPVAVALSKADIALRNLTLRTPTLDDVFLEVTGGHFQPETEIE